MNASTFSREMQAYELFQKLMSDGERTKEAFEEAGMPLPPPLARFLGAAADAGQRPSEAQDQKVIYPSIPLPDPPEGAGGDWIAIPAEGTQATNLMLGILRRHDGPLSGRQLHVEVSEFNADIALGSLQNAASRLGEAVIDRRKEGWVLSDASSAPIIHEGYAWGPPRIFQKQEMAAHRRMVIAHVLNLSSDALMSMQIVRSVIDSKLCKAPVTKDLVKCDLAVMVESGVVKKVPGTRKYTTSQKLKKNGS